MRNLVLFFFLALGTLQAQENRTNPSCEYLMPQPLEFLLDGSLSSEGALEEKLAPLTSCGLDAYDIAFFSNMNKMSAVLKKLTSTKTVESLTYEDLLRQIQAVMDTQTYGQIKKTTLLSDDLGARVGTESSWETDLVIFQELGASQRVIDAVASYIKEHPNNQKTYREILETIDANK
jgi:hypothetical protein